MNAPSLLALPVARASAPSNRSKTPPNTTRSPASEPGLDAGRDGGDAGDHEADERQRVGREPEPAEPDGDRRRRGRGRGPASRARRASRSRGGLARSRAARRGRAPALAARRTPSNASGTKVWTVSRPCRRVVTSPTSRSLPRCHDTSGWDSPTCSMSSVTVAGPRRGAGRSGAGSRRRAPCGTLRSSRSSSGWSTTEAMVLRMRAGEGDTGYGDLQAWGRSRRRINGGLYQCALILRARSVVCQRDRR